MCSTQHSTARPSRPTTATMSSSRPLSRIGPRQIATGRQTIGERGAEQQPGRPRRRRQVQRVDLADAAPGRPSSRRPASSRTSRSGPGSRAAPTATVIRTAARNSHGPAPAGGGGRGGSGRSSRAATPGRTAPRRPATTGAAAARSRRPRCTPGRPRSGTSSTRRRGRRCTSPRSWPERVALEQRGVDRDRRRAGRTAPAAAAGPGGRRSPRRLTVPGALVLADQQQRDQVARDHEEHLDAEEPARQPRRVGVVHHHREHGERRASRRGRAGTGRG